MDVDVVVGVTFAFQLLYNAASSVQNEKGGVQGCVCNAPI